LCSSYWFLTQFVPACSLLLARTASCCFTLCSSYWSLTLLVPICGLQFAYTVEFLILVPDTVCSCLQPEASTSEGAGAAGSAKAEGADKAGAGGGDGSGGGDDKSAADAAGGGPAQDQKEQAKEQKDQAKEPPKELEEALLVCKWGGVLTHAGRQQAEDLGKVFRLVMYPR
jgi:hypothetical protein